MPFRCKGPWRPEGDFLFGSCNIGAHWWLLEPVVKIEVWMAASNIAQEHEEGIMGKLPGLGRGTLNPPLLVRLQLLDQLIEEDSQLGAWNPMLVDREGWVTTHKYRGSQQFSRV